MAEYDLVVLGSGIAGSIAALVLKKIGLSVLVVERKTHPRFVIGESTIPTTTLMMQELARTYDIPELAEVTHYVSLREHGCRAWPKQHFWYGTHQDGKPLDPKHEHMLEALLLPMGPDVHMFRADADQFLASKLEKYGITYVENTETLDVVHDAGGVTLRLRGPDGEYDARAKLIVDATGHASFLATRHGLRHADAHLQTNTRSLFGHFEGVADLDEAVGGRNPQYRFRRDAGTMHHCFRGGWIWVIPFDHGVTSVGVQLDRRIHPLDESITPEAELAAVLARYPSIQAHLGAMKPVRPLIRTGRIQFTCESILGPGFVLTPHAAAFVEPLFSTGILLTLTFVSRFAKAAREAKDANDWSAERFKPIETLFFAELKQIDRIVDGMIQSFRDYEVFKQYWRFWAVGTFAQWCTSILAAGATRTVPMLYGAAFPGFADEVEAVHAMVRDQDADPLQLATALKAHADVWWDKICEPVFAAFGELSVGSTGTLCVRGAGDLSMLIDKMKGFAAEIGPLDPIVQGRNAELYAQRAEVVLGQQLARYHESKRDGTAYAPAFDRVLANANPDTFDYGAHIGLPPAE